MMLLTQLLEIPFETFGAIEDVNIYHYFKPSTTKAPYATWQEENDDAFYSDNVKSERSLNGILDYYTEVKDSVDSNLDVLCFVPRPEKPSVFWKNSRVWLHI